MLFQPKPFKYLDIIHLATLIPLATIIVCLLVLSVLNKLNDCSGFYTRCQQISNQRYLSSPPIEEILGRDFTASLQLLVDKATNNNNLFKQDYDINYQPAKHTNISDYPAENHQQAVTIYWSYDWIGLDQYAIVSSLLILVLFGSLSALLRRRRLVFIAILIYLVELTQLALIEASDDRDFPASIFRDGHTLARYSLIYTNTSQGYFILKICFLALNLINLILLTIYFVLLRYKSIFQELDRYN